jgi:hypothetical protein
MDQCRNCQSSNLVRVEMTLSGGPVRFAHCRRCEHRWWVDSDGNTVLLLQDVLEKAAS